MESCTSPSLGMQKSRERSGSTVKQQAHNVFIEEWNCKHIDTTLDQISESSGLGRRLENGKKPVVEKYLLKMAYFPWQFSHVEY